MDPAPGGGSGGNAAAGAGASTGTLSNMLATAAAYVPTEIITLYTFVLGLVVVDSAGSEQTGAASSHLPMWAFWLFLGGTVLITVVLFVNKCIGEGRGLPKQLRSWPIWEALSAGVGFTVWSTAIPRGAFVEEAWYSTTVGAVMLGVFSVVWPLLGVGVVYLLRRDAPAATDPQRLGVPANG